MEYNISICDDSAGDCRYVAALVRNWATASENKVSITVYPSAEAFLFDYAENRACDMLLLDIEMKRINGIELAKDIRRDNEVIQIIFITGYPDFILEGYEVSALHYLIKPVAQDKLSAVLYRAQKNLSKRSRIISFSVDGQNVFVPVDEIVSVEIFDHLLEIQTRANRFTVKMPLSEIENELTGDFVRCHRGCIVNLRYINKITKTDVILDSEKALPLSRRLYAEVNRAMMKYIKDGGQK